MKYKVKVTLRESLSTLCYTVFSDPLYDEQFLCLVMETEEGTRERKYIRISQIANFTITDEE